MKYGCPNNNSELEHRREAPPLQPCWRGAGRHAGGAGLICRGGSRWHLVRQKRRATLLVVFVPLNTALLVVFVVGLLCACPRCFLAAHMVATMNFRVYELGSMNFSVVAHSPRIPLGKQLNVPQPGFSPL